jgi:3-oxoadipate enol-lactonase
LLRSLTLLDTSAAPEDKSAAIQDKALAFLYRFAGIGPVRGSVEKIMFGPAFRNDPKSKAIVDEWIAMLSRCDKAGIQQAVLGVANRRGVEDEIGAIKMPTLVMCGAQDKPTPPARSRQIADLIPGARLEMIADSGHSSTIEQPEAVTELLKSFLAEVG